MKGKEKLLSMREELRNYQFWKAVRCEFTITLLYVVLGCGATATWKQDQLKTNPAAQRQDPQDSLACPDPTVRAALAFGLAAATLIQCVGHISGGHLNPAVTLAMLVTRNVSVLRASCYIVAQLSGAIAGAAILYGITHHNAGASGGVSASAPFPAGPSPLGVTQVAPALGLGQAFGVEFLGTFVVVLTVFANLETKRSDLGSRSLSIGLSIAAAHLFAFPYTGASMNPARSLGPAIIMNSWHNHWVYWVGPVLGGIIGGFTHEYTQDSSGRLTTLRRSFPRGGRRSRDHRGDTQSLPGICRLPPAGGPSNEVPCSTGLRRTRSTHSTNSTLSTEMTATPTDPDPDLRI